MESELTPRYDTRGSFYNKAKLIQEGDITKLRSYNTIVAEYNHQTNEVKVYGWFSATTGRHINEFLQQFGFDKCTKAEMEDFKQHPESIHDD